MPDKILNAPEILPGLEIYYIAFMDLINSRQIGMGLGGIWWETIERYCERRGIDGHQQEAMHHHIGKLDAVYLGHQSKKSGGGSLGERSAVQSKHQKKK